MRVHCEVEEVDLDGDGDYTVEGVIVTRSRCEHQVEAFGTSPRSLRSCLVRMRQDAARRVQFLHGRERRGGRWAGDGRCVVTAEPRTTVRELPIRLREAAGICPSVSPPGARAASLGGRRPGHVARGRSAATSGYVADWSSSHGRPVRGLALPPWSWCPATPPARVPAARRQPARGAGPVRRREIDCGEHWEVALMVTNIAEDTAARLEAQILDRLRDGVGGRGQTLSELVACGPAGALVGA